MPTVKRRERRKQASFRSSAAFQSGWSFQRMVERVPANMPARTPCRVVRRRRHRDRLVLLVL
ncbi:MAG: hypothetical protein JW958_03725, partial [Candidatus Eisenbacteria bacterium]|nr:hypothetical protein [Candidatus Eisenbacteria bacterium]